MLEGSIQKLEELFEEDPFARQVYEEERARLLINKYLENRLSDTESIELDERIKKEPSLKKEIRLRKRVNFLTDHLHLIDALDQSREAAETDESEEYLAIKRKLHRTRLIPVIKWAAAASILFLITYTVTFSLPNNTGDETKLFRDFYTPLSNETMVNYYTNSSVLGEAKAKYYNSNYQDALIIFQSLPDALDIRTEKNFYIGLSMLELGHYPEAIKALDSVTQNTSFESLPQAYWYLGLSYLRAGQKQKAIETFSYIVSSDGYNSEKAEEVLKKLR
jgi:tetratricopeptide (TPR) repeat protein